MSPPNQNPMEMKQRCIPSRYTLIFLMCWGNIAYTALQLNLNLTIVAMVNQTALQYTTLSSDECVIKEEPVLDVLVIDLNDNDTSIVPFVPSEDIDDKFVKMNGELLWSPYTQGLLLGAIFFGYITTHLIGGLLAEILGGKWVLFCGILIPSLLAFFIPAAARHGVESIFFVRVLQGLAAGVVTPVFYSMVGKWAPVHERSRIIATLQFGSIFGSALIVVLSGLISSSVVLGGWPTVFYVSGAFGLCFALAWALWGYSSPDDHPSISYEEKLFIKNSIEESSALKKRDAKAPWFEVVKSAPFWSLFLVRFTYAWGSYTEQTAIPLFMQTVFNIPIEQNGYINGAMYSFSALSAVIGGFTADQLRRRTSLGINSIRKSFSVMAYVGAAFCWTSVALSGCSVLTAAIFIVLSKFFLALSIAGDYVAIVDMAPQYAGTLSGVLFTVADMTGFLSPLVTGAIIDDNVTLSQWSYVFYCVSFIVILGMLAFVCFGSAELQPWAMEDPTNFRQTAGSRVSLVTSNKLLTSSRPTEYGSTSLRT